jgi:hypothetical protein
LRFLQRWIAIQNNPVRDRHLKANCIIDASKGNQDFEPLSGRCCLRPENGFTTGQSVPVVVQAYQEHGSEWAAIGIVASSIQKLYTVIQLHSGSQLLRERSDIFSLTTAADWSGMLSYKSARGTGNCAAPGGSQQTDCSMLGKILIA